MANTKTKGYISTAKLGLKFLLENAIYLGYYIRMEYNLDQRRFTTEEPLLAVGCGVRQS